MKNMKKILALVLALMLVLGMTSALAAGTSSTADVNSGSITVANYDASATYTAYKIFDVTYADNTSTEYAYTISSSSPWYSVVSTYAATTANGLTLTAVPGTSTTYNVTTSDAFSAPAFAAHLKSNVGDVTDTGAQTLTNGSATNLPLGYWFVTTTTGSLCNLTTTDPSVTINDKNIIVFEKEEDKVTVEVGEVVTYTLTAKVLDTTGYTKYFYTFTDTMSDGLTFNTDSLNMVIKEGNTVKATLISGGAVQNGIDGVAYATAGQTYVTPPATKGGDNGSATVAANSFAITMGDYIKSAAGQAFVNDDIVITYTATVNANAIQHDEENNDAHLIYSNNPNDDSSFDHRDDKEHLYTFNIVIDKYVNGQNGQKLPNAEFILYKRGEGTTTQPASGDYDTVTTGGTTTYYPITYYVYTAGTAPAAAVSWTATKSSATVKTTDASGATEFDGLKAGTYYLLETKAPDGYNLLTAPVEIVLTATKDNEYPSDGHPEPYVLSATVDTANATVVHTEDNNITDPVNGVVQDNDVNVGVPNQSGTELPSTGGIGTTIFYVAGGILVLAAVILLVTKRRMGAND